MFKELNSHRRKRTLCAGRGGMPVSATCLGLWRDSRAPRGCTLLSAEDCHLSLPAGCSGACKDCCPGERLPWIQPECLGLGPRQAPGADCPDSMPHLQLSPATSCGPPAQPLLTTSWAAPRGSLGAPTFRGACSSLPSDLGTRISSPLCCKVTLRVRKS